MCSQNQTASWKLKVIRQNVYHDTENVIPIIPVCGSSSCHVVSCGLGIIHVVGPFPVCCWYSPVCGEPFARVWWTIRPCVVVHSPVCGCAFAVVHIRPMWLHSPCGCARVCVWLVIRLCVVVAFARVWLSIRPCVVDHSPVCGSSKTNPTSRKCNIVKG